MLPFDINVSTISWIDRALMSAFDFSVNPISAATKDWLDMLCYGMYHTANAEPPKIFHGKKDITKLKQQYRSLTTYQSNFKSAPTESSTRCADFRIPMPFW